MSEALSNETNSSPSYDDLLAANLRLEQELQFLRFQLDELLHEKFGSSSQKSHDVSRLQGNLFNPSELASEKQEDDEEDYTDVAPHRRKRRSKKSIPENLPVEVIEYAPERTHCDCGCELKEFSRDTRDEVEHRPARFFIRRHVVIHSSCRSVKPSTAAKFRSSLVR